MRLPKRSWRSRAHGTIAPSPTPVWFEPSLPRTAEFVQLDSALQPMKMKRICVFCGSSDKVDGAYLKAATATGRELARRELELVYGGGSTGLMGAVADAVLEAGGRAIGVLPRFFDTPELAHTRLSELHLVDTMHERKSMMAEMSQGFIALPGGLGTMEELFEILTWAQIGLHRHPVGALNVADYFTPLIEFIDHAQREGFLYSEHRSLLNSEADPARLLDKLQSYQPPEGLERWLQRGGEEK